MILTRKLQPPGLPVGVVPRGRLDELFARLLEDHEALAVFASAGSGKTVQAQMFAAREGLPLAWLTLDSADRSGPRLLTYLAGALSRVSPEAESVARATLDSGLSLPEVAASLAEVVQDQPLLIVLDDCETISGSEEAAAVLAAFLDYLPPKARTLLLSREELEVPIGRMMLQGRVGRVTDADLALEVDEARSLLAALGGETSDASALMDATRGWIAAVAFNVRTDLRSSPGPDALASYLSHEVLARLPEEEQRFLLRTSLLRAVSARGAAALCGREGYAIWQSLGSRHLPATMTADRALVYHPKFREFLRERLQLHMPAEVPDLQRRHARYLEELDAHEEAVEAYLEVGEVENAALAAERALPSLYARADWRLLERWLDALGHEVVDVRPLLQGARVRSLYGCRRIPEAQARIRRLDSRGELGEVAKADPGVVAYIGWALQWQPSEALRLLREHEGDYRADAVRYEIEAVSGRDPVVPPAGREWSDMERILTWGLLVQGRLDELLRMLPAEDEWPPRSFYRTPHPLLALVLRGDLVRARELLDQVPAAMREGAHTDLWYFHEAWLLWAEGDVEGALRVAEAAVEHSRKTRFGWEPCFHVAVGCMLIALGRIDDARSVLADSISQSAASGVRAYVEWAQTFQGLAFLASGRPKDAARVLRQAVADMQRAGRRLVLPLAALYLSEAEAELGDPDKAAASADLAYEVSDAMSARFLLQQGLRHVPAVLQRQIERDPDEVRWRRLLGLRAPAGSPAVVPSATEQPTSFLDVQTFGDAADLVLDGTALTVRRIKALELAAALALHPDGIDRQRLQEQLFPDADQRRGGNYFRQVVHKLRQLTGIGLTRTSQGFVRWPDDVRVDTTDLRFERLLHGAGSLVGRDRFNALLAASDLVAGPYLAESELEWVVARRFELDVLAAEASAEAAELALELNDTANARALAERTIAANPYSETAYRVLMQVEAISGPTGGVLTMYQRLCASLGELGVTPTAATEKLLRELRGS